MPAARAVGRKTITEKKEGSVATLLAWQIIDRLTFEVTFLLFQPEDFDCGRQDILKLDHQVFLSDMRMRIVCAFGERGDELMV